MLATKFIDVPIQCIALHEMVLRGSNCHISKFLIVMAQGF
jgi:hypothetical protein